MRVPDLVARLGGDEFTVLVDDIQSPEEATLVADRIQKHLALPFDLSGREVRTSASIGIALDAGYRQPEDVLRDADTAMYRAKLLGKARYQIFDKNMHSDAMNVLEIGTSCGLASISRSSAPREVNRRSSADAEPKDLRDWKRSSASPA